MRKGSRPSWSLLLLVIFACTAHASAAIPDWVRQAAFTTLPTYEPDTNAVVLLDEARVAVTSLNDYHEHYRRVVKILRPEGRDQAEFTLYLEAKEKLHSVHCWSIDHSGKEFELKYKDFMERDAFFGFDLYNDVRVRTATCPGADPGAVVAFEYEAQRHQWVNEFEWAFQESIPVHESRVALQLPHGWEFRTQWTNGDSVEPSRLADGIWDWTLRDLPPESGASYAGSWEALGRWYTQLTSDRRIPTPEITQKAQQLVSGKVDFDGKVRAMASFLQSDVRYIAIEIGIGGYQPHPAGDIFHARYRDPLGRK